MEVQMELQCMWLWRGDHLLHKAPFNTKKEKKKKKSHRHRKGLVQQDIAIHRSNLGSHRLSTAVLGIWTSNQNCPYKAGPHGGAKYQHILAQSFGLSLERFSRFGRTRQTHNSLEKVMHRLGKQKTALSFFFVDISCSSIDSTWTLGVMFRCLLLLVCNFSSSDYFERIQHLALPENREENLTLLDWDVSLLSLVTFFCGSLNNKQASLTINSNLCLVSLGK